MKSIQYSIILFLLSLSQQIQPNFNWNYKESLSASDIPEQSFIVTPVASGEQLVRTSLPLPKGFLTEGKTLIVNSGKKSFVPGLRALSWYPVKPGESKSVRRGMVTFAFNFKDLKPVRFLLTTNNSNSPITNKIPVSLSVINDSITVSWKNGTKVYIKLIAPERRSYDEQPMEIIESNEFYCWQRVKQPDPKWPRIIEMRYDALGCVTLIAHIQRIAEEDGFAPESGWEILSNEKIAGARIGSSITESENKVISHNFTNGKEALWIIGKDVLAIYHPTAHLRKRGKIDVSRTQEGKLLYRYLRSKADDRIPMQAFSWQRIEIVLAPPELAKLRPTLESPHPVMVSPKLWTEVYGIRPDLPADLPNELERLIKYHNDAIISSVCVGDDWGNVTNYTDGVEQGSVLGMNRLNHCAPIFLDGWYYGDQKLIETAVNWCNNFYDQSIWWGEPERGGTRYNDIIRMGKTPLSMEYMWRSNNSSNFCTKGYDAFFLAWEQTGNPLMKEALEAQISYAMEHVHADRGECRNIGDVRDFIRLYFYTGEERFLNHALRLFRELRTKVSTGDLFDQGGLPIDPDPPYIEDDNSGYKVGYAKPYIIGYALCGLPELIPYAPDEPKLHEVVQAVATFLAESQDPAGGWRYPHPHSSSVNFSSAMEGAWQIVQASRILGPDEKLLNAIEAILRQRLQGWLHTGNILSSLSGWEISTGKVKRNMELYSLYKKPADRDASRDYSEGNPRFGTAPPEGLVYFREVLAYYLQHRPASRLLVPPRQEEPLSKVLQRIPVKEK